MAENKDFYAIESQSQSRRSGRPGVRCEKGGAFLVDDLGDMVVA